MRILIAHTAYQQRGGEDAVVEAETALLRGHGHEVSLYQRHNDEIPALSRATLAAETLWSRRTLSDLQTLFARQRPDIIHVHNTFPLISPSLYWAAHRAGIPVVQTLHNFRLLCPQAMFLREGQVCEACLGRLPLPGLRHGCYRDSTAQTAVLAGMLTLHRGLGTYARKVTRFIALNAFCRQKFIEGGLPADKLSIKPNFVDWEATDPVSTVMASTEADTRHGFLFVGRLSAEKGLEVLARAAAMLGDEVALRVVGSGPEASRLVGLRGVTPLGSLNSAAVHEEMARALALVMPSIWYENFPRTLVEAFASGLPVIASRLGALAELVRDGETGLLFTPGDAEDLAEKLRWARHHPAAMARMGAAARADYVAHYTPEINYRQLMVVYREAMEST